MVPKRAESQKIIKDGSKLQRWMLRGDPLEYQEKNQKCNYKTKNGLEEPIIKEIEQNKLAWYGHFQ